jgi:hypothetical protein
MKILGFEIPSLKRIPDYSKKLLGIEAEWAEGSTDPANLMIYDWFTGEGDTKEATSYPSIVLQLIRKYTGFSRLGRELTKSIIETRVTWIAGNGVNISAKGAKEKKFLEEFVRYNKLDGVTFRDQVTNSELENKALAIPIWKPADSMVDIKWLCWADSDYEVQTDPEDYRFITGIKYGKSKDKQMKAGEFVFQSFSGLQRLLNTSPPRTGLVLFDIDAVSLALRDLRKINHKFGAAFPFFKTQTNEDAKNLMRSISQRKWKIGDTIAAVADGSYMEPSGSGLESIIKEILMHFRIISQATGIPVYFMAPDLMSNRATAQELLEMIQAATNSERENWKDFITELCSQAMQIYSKKTGILLNYKDVNVSLPSVTLNQVQQLVDVYLPLQQAGIISKEFVREKVPDVDPALEKRRLLEEDELDTETDPIETLKAQLKAAAPPKEEDPEEDDEPDEEEEN